MAARIVAIADTFDAVTHARRYRAGRSSSVGAQVIADGRGTQFDPALVDLFLLPPVLARVRTEMHSAHRVERGTLRRARGGDMAAAPDISFRWRETAPAQTWRDRLRHASRVSTPH